jgi:hypothetical protein
MDSLRQFGRSLVETDISKLTPPEQWLAKLAGFSHPSPRVEDPTHSSLIGSSETTESRIPPLFTLELETLEAPRQSPSQPRYIDTGDRFRLPINRPKRYINHILSVLEGESCNPSTKETFAICRDLLGNSNSPGLITSNFASKTLELAAYTFITNRQYLDESSGSLEERLDALDEVAKQFGLTPNPLAQQHSPTTGFESRIIPD